MVDSETRRGRQPGRVAGLRVSFSAYGWVWLGVVIVYGLMLVLTPGEASIRGLATSSPYIGMLAIVTIGQTLVIMQRGIDFSVVGALLASGMVVAYLTHAGWDLVPAMLVTMAVGLAIGALNGALVVLLNLTPLVATLAANGLYLGVAKAISHFSPIHVSQALNEVGRSKVFGVSAILVVGIVATVIAVVFVKKTAAGRRFTAVGSSAPAARASGIATGRYVMLAYVAAGLCYALAGTLIAGYIGDSRLSTGGTYLMASIAAVVIGGTPLTGGRGSLVASFGGAVFMSLLAQMVLSLGVPTAIQQLVQAGVLVIAITLPSVTGMVQRSRQKKRAATAASQSS